MEIIVLKLENEASFHRRVDFWFLLDSVTQVAHSQKGEFGVGGRCFGCLERGVVVRLSTCVVAGAVGVFLCVVL